MDKGNTEFVNGERVRLSKRQKVGRHCRRFWWLHLIIFIAVTLIIVLPVVYVGYPNIAQHDINKSSLNVTAQTTTDPAPDSMTLNLTSSLVTHSSYHPTLRAFNATVYLPDSDIPLYSFASPQVGTASSGVEEHIFQRVELPNPDEFARFSVILAQNKTVTLYVKGRGGLKLGALPETHVNYNTPSTISGLNGLKDLVMTNFTLLKTAYSNGTNAMGVIAINNPSVLTLAMGDVTQTQFVDGIQISNSTLPNFTLLPGNNTYPIYFTTNETATVQVLQKPQYKCGLFDVDIKTNASTYNGQEIPYFTQALQSATLTTQLNIAPALNQAGLGFVLGKGCSS